MKDYPIQVFNWHIGEAKPSIQEGQVLTGKCIMGGLQRFDITDNRLSQLKEQIEGSIAEMGGTHHILTPGCGVRLPFDQETIQYIHQVKSEVESALK